MRTYVVLALFATIFTFLTVSSYTQKSATWDEPQHLTAGYLALTRSDYRLDPEHPPLLRMWAALPLSGMSGIHLDTTRLPTSWNDDWVFYQQFFFCHDFFYGQTNADSLLNRSRFMIVLLGVGLGILLFGWARELFGFWPAVIVLGLYCTEPNILAHAGVVSTDLGVTCFAFGAVYFLWRTTRNLHWGNLAGLAIFSSLALVSKFTAVLLVPITVALLVARVLRRDPWPTTLRRDGAMAAVRLKALAAAVVVFGLCATSYFTLWAAYSFRYAPASGTGQQFLFESSERIALRAPRLAQAINWIDRHHLLPNAYAQGFLVGQAKAQERTAYLAGSFSLTGWWYYFPAAFVLKTPIPLIGLFVGGLLLALKRRTMFLQNELFVLLPIVVYLAAAMVSKLNIGLRHILPIYPFVMITAGSAVAALLAPRRKSFVAALIALCLFQVFELVRVAPHYLTFFNAVAGGPSRGHEYLIDSNLDWGQDLKGLKRWMDDHHVEHINLSYFGTADPAYYGIRCTHLPGAPFFAAESVTFPQLPGYVAVSVNNLHGLYMNEYGKAFYQPLLERTPDAVIGNTIYVYWVERPWWSR